MNKFFLISIGLMLFSCKTLQKKVDQRDTASLKKEFAKYGAEILYEYKNINGFAIRIPKEKSLEQAKTHFSKVKGVLSVEKDEKVEINQ